ncbi:NAD-dependent epimerase/dehydratase family protein [Sarocladium implicatum]|nr:NAD-dependent epimerase/dehydratase family protein [Sarocladium implicatum]
MSKSEFSAAVGEELPPPYSVTNIQSVSQSTPRIASHHTESIPGLFSGQLDNLRSQIQSEEATRQDAREQLDTQTLSLLVPYVEDLLSHIATVNPTPSLAEMLLIPDAAVDREWMFSEPAEMKPGEVRRIIRVKQHSKLASDEKRSTSPPTRSSLFSSQLSAEGPKEFTSWGRWDDDSAAAAATSGSRAGDLWFSDQDMAHRLARHLQPAPKVDRATVREQVASQKKPDKKPSRFGGLLRRDAPVPLLDRVSSGAPAPEQEDVAMKVKAEEVSFRKENEMGIWESKTGWAIAVRVHLRSR